MPNLNRVFLMGNLTRDPELRYVPSGTAVATFTMATNRVYMTQSGEKKEEPAFIRIVAWGRRAEVCGEYLSKGSPVFVEGRLRSRSWQTQEGQTRSTIEVIAQTVQFLRGPVKTGTAPSQEEHAVTEEPPMDEAPPEEDVSQPKTGKASSKTQNEEVPF